MRAIKFFVIVGILGLAIASCEKIESMSHPMGFNVKVNKVETKGQSIDVACDLKDFYLFGWFEKWVGANGLVRNEFYPTTTTYALYNLKENGDYIVDGGTDINNNPLWEKNKSTKFWAWNNNDGIVSILSQLNYDIDDSPLKLTIKFNVNTCLAENQKDMVVAFGQETHGESIVNDRLTLFFKHLMSKIKFIDNMPESIKTIVIKNTLAGAECEITQNLQLGVIETIVWGTQEAGLDACKTKTMNGASDNFFLIPQTGTVNFEITLIDESVLQKEVSINWSPGFEYTYKLSSSQTNNAYAATKATMGSYDVSIDLVEETLY